MKGKADRVLYSTAIYNGIDAKTADGAVAVAGSKIIYAGDRDGATEYIAGDTQVTDYGGRLIMPGFFDDHVHVLQTALHKKGALLSDTVSEEQAAQRVGEYAAANPGDGWVLGFGWMHTYFADQKLPTRASLDAVVPKRPVCLQNAECHALWCNSAALELAGITRDSDGVKESYIVTDEAGEPTGVLYESAMAPVIALAFSISRDKQVGMLGEFSEDCARFGITSVTDMMPYLGKDSGDLDAYFEHAQGKKSVRIHAAICLSEENIEKARLCREKWKNTDKLNCLGFKEFIDGVPSTHTALLAEPYSDMPGFCGSAVCDLDDLAERIDRAYEAGFGIRLHACGDGAVRFALQSYGRSVARHGPAKPGQRLCIEHVEALTDEDLALFAEYGVIASMQPEHLTLISATDQDEAYRIWYGSGREHTLWRFRDLLGSGAVVAFGTDSPVVTLDPFTGLYRALSRLHDDGLPAGGWIPSQKLTIFEALHAYTYASAYAAGAEESLGSLSPGKLADITVVDRDLTKCTPDQVRQAKADMTMIGGEVVYSAQAK